MNREHGSIVRDLTETKGDYEYLDIGKFLDQIDPKKTCNTVVDLGNIGDVQKAEIMWSLYREVNRDLWSAPNKEISRTVSSSGEVLKTQSKEQRMSSDKKMQQKVSLLRALWSDVSVQDFFKANYTRHLEQEKTMNGEYDKWKKLKAEVHSLEKGLKELTISLVGSRGSRDGEMDMVMYGVLSGDLENKINELQNLLTEKPELAAQSAYEELVGYQRELKNRGFVRFPSRKVIEKKITEKALTGRPIMLLSESGAGKTALVSDTAINLTGLPVSKIVGGKDKKVGSLFATRDLTGGKSYYRYGPITEALTGKSSELDKQRNHDGRLLLDDEFNQRTSEAQMELIKSLGKIVPGGKFQVPDTTLSEKIAGNAIFVVAGNPMSDRYPRNDTDVAVEREFAGNIVTVDYLEQSVKNPELYQLLLVGLMDANHRIRANKKEIEPSFIIQDGKEIFDASPGSGGFLWNFANAWKDMYDSFSHKEHLLCIMNPTLPKEEFYFDKLLLGYDVVLGWINEYKKFKVGTSLENFMKEKLTDFFAQQTISDEDRKLAKKILEQYDIDLSIKSTDLIHTSTLTPQEIGWLLPNVARPVREIKKPESYTVLSVDGEEIEYTIKEVFGYEPGSKFQYISNRDKEFILKKIPDYESGSRFQYANNKDKKITLVGESIEGFAVLKDEDNQMAVVIETLQDLIENYEKDIPPTPEALSPEQAEQIIGKEQFFGPQEVQKVWGVELSTDQIPPIPYNQEDLEKARKNNMYLILRVNNDKEGNPLTAQRMNAQKQADFTRQGNGKILSNPTGWYKDEDFFTKVTPDLSWALVSGDILPSSTSNNYLHQTKIIRDSLKKQNWLSAEEEQSCTDDILKSLSEEMGVDWDTQEITNQTKYSTNHKKVAQKASKLPINQKHRQSFAEVLYDFISLLESKKKRVLIDGYTWTRDLSSSGSLVSVGGCDDRSASVDVGSPGRRGGSLGVSFSR